MSHYPELTPEHATWAQAQPLFFVASAPLATDGHVNLSPRGLDTFRVLDSRRVGFLDLTGSGNETAAHIIENGRITLMFCAFSGEPRILRIYGRGRALFPGTADWDAVAEAFPTELPGVRQIILIDIGGVQSSCGFAVPLMDYRGERDKLLAWAENKGPEGLAEYRARKNAVSLDGLPVPLRDG